MSDQPSSELGGGPGDAQQRGAPQADKHSHDHSHDHSRLGAGPVKRAPLGRGAGCGKVLFLDAQSGLAGDMISAALADLGVPLEVLEGQLAKLSLRGYRVELEHGLAGAIGAARFNVIVEPGHPERSYASIQRLLSQSGLDAAVRERAETIFARLARAEAEVHRMPLEQVHFHEVGAVDAIVDIVSASIALDYLGADLVVSPLPLGHGSVRCRHGNLPLPAPAAVLCLKGVPTYPAGIEAELVTPTGAAIVGAMAKSFARWPQLSPERVGWGMGTRTLPDRPNALRAVLGESWSQLHAAEGAPYQVLEANVDDVSGEVAGHVLQRLLEAGALDAWATPVLMKKGRPGLVLAALCRSSDEPQVGGVLMRESTTIGYRRSSVSRAERPRQFLQVETAYGQVSVKVSAGPYGPPQVKPEFDRCAALAREQGVPVRVVLLEAAAAAQTQLQGTAAQTQLEAPLGSAEAPAASAAGIHDGNR